MESEKVFGHSFLESLAIKKDFRSKRFSSWDKSGKNLDFFNLKPKEKRLLAEIKGPGCIKHIYNVNISFDPYFYRNLILRIYWDGEKNPSVEVPLGDFFGIGHCRPRLFSSQLLSVNPGNPLNIENYYTYGLNCYFPMPFSSSAVVEVENQSDIPVEVFWFHIDFQEYKSLDNDVFRFHAQWNREDITKVTGDALNSKNMSLWDGVNLTDKENYVILDTEGDGQLIGILLNVDNIAGDWWGEGDDMVFIDGESWPPSIHGTGTEEIFGGGACPSNEYYTNYCGYQLISNSNWYRQNSMYRFFITDPIRFNKSIKYTIEHGHANNFENDYSSVAYWYQLEPHKNFRIKPANKRFPLSHLTAEKEIIERHIEIMKSIYKKMPQILTNTALESGQIALLLTKHSLAEKAYFEGRYDLALNEWNQIHKMARNWN